jgi:hypothetical protein
MVNPEMMPPFPDQADETPQVDSTDGGAISLVTLRPREGAAETVATSDQVVDSLTAAARAGDTATMHKIYSSYNGNPEAMEGLAAKFDESMSKYGFKTEFEPGSNRMIISSTDEHGTTKELFIGAHPLEVPYGRTDNGREGEDHVTPDEFGKLMQSRMETFDKYFGKSDVAGLSDAQAENMKLIRGALLAGNGEDLQRGILALADNPQPVMDALSKDMERAGIQFKRLGPDPGYPDRTDRIQIAFRDRPGDNASVSARLDIPFNGDKPEAQIVDLTGEPGQNPMAQNQELFLRMVRMQLGRRA